MHLSSTSLIFAFLASLGLLVSCSSQKGNKGAPDKDVDEPVIQPAKNVKPIPIDPLPAGAIARMGTSRWRVGRGFGLAFSPDGKYLACSSQAREKNLVLLEVDSGKIIQDYPVFSPYFSFSRTGKGLLSADSDGLGKPVIVQEYDTASGNKLNQFTFSEGVFQWSSDGKFFLSVSTVASLYDTQTGKRIHTWNLPNQNTAPCDAAVSPDGKMVAFRHHTHHSLFESATGKELHRLPNSKWSGVNPVPGNNIPSFSADGKELVSVEKDKICFWSTVTGKISRCFELPKNQPWALALSADNRFLAAATKIGHVCIWELTGNKLLHKIQGLNSFLAFSADGKMLAGRDGEAIRIWDVLSGEEITPGQAPNSQVASAFFSPDSKILVSLAGPGDPISLWETATGKLIRQFPIPPQKILGEPGKLSISPHGKTLAFLNSEQLLIWDLPSGRELYQKQISRLVPSREKPFGNEVTSDLLEQCLFLPDGKTLLMVYRGRSEGKSQRLVRPARIVFWDVEQRKEKRFFEIPGEIWPTIVLSPNGKTLASFGDSFFLFDVESGKQLWHGKRPDAYVLSFSANGKTLMWGKGQTVYLWDVETKEIREQVQFHVENGSTPLITKTGLAVVCKGKTIHVLDFQTRKELGQFSGHEKSISYLSFSEDDRFLASASIDTTILIWDLAKLKK
jgi:WD40 repeat protein